MTIEVLTIVAYFSFIVALSRKQVPILWNTFFLTIFLGGNLWKGKLTLILQNLSLSKPQIAKDVSLGISHPNKKEPPIEVTVGGEASVTPVWPLPFNYLT